MSNKSRRRVKMAAGAMLAGAALPIAAAGTAWADVDISYDGKVVIDTFPGAPLPGQSDAGTQALSGTQNDLATYSGPASNTEVGLANDSVGTDKNDIAYASNSSASQTPSSALISDAQNSTATATTGGHATIENLTPGTGTVTNDAATASNGGTADVLNAGGTGAVSHDVATANGTGSVAAVGAVGVGPSTGDVQFDSAKASSGGEAIVSNGSFFGAGPGGTGNVDFNSATASNGGGAGIGNLGGSADVTLNTANASGTGSTAGVIDSNTAGTSSEAVTANSATATHGGHAAIGNDGAATQPVTFDTANANNGTAQIADANASSATAVNTGPVTAVGPPNNEAVSPGAYVVFGSFDSATAHNPGSTAGVTGTATDYTIFSHAVETAGGTTIVTTSFDPSVNVAPSGGESFVAPTGHEMFFMPDHMMPFVP